MALSNLASRVLFAVIAIPVVIAAAYLGALVLALLLALVAGLAAWEFYRIAKVDGYTPMTGVGTTLALLLPLAVHFFRVGVFRPPPIVLGAAVVLALLALAIWLRGPDGHPLGAVAVTALGVLYTGGLLSFAYALRHHNYIIDARAGTALLVFPLVLTWISDSAGFFVGRAVGRHRLISSVSPGKTVEGAIGALVLTIIAAWAYTRWVMVPVAQLALTPLSIIIFGGMISIAVQLGDLFESLIKREAGVKDSSHLIPGHGGVLDRIDGLLFALPIAYLLISYPRFLLVVVR